jgi:hypothetical protein
MELKKLSGLQYRTAYGAFPIINKLSGLATIIAQKRLSELIIGSSNVYIAYLLNFFEILHANLSPPLLFKHYGLYNIIMASTHSYGLFTLSRPLHTLMVLLALPQPLLACNVIALLHSLVCYCHSHGLFMRFHGHYCTTISQYWHSKPLQGLLLPL